MGAREGQSDGRARRVHRIRSGAGTASSANGSRARRWGCGHVHEARGLRHNRAVSTTDLPDSIAGNIAEWTKNNAEYTDGNAERAWTPRDISWGVFGVREDAIGSPLGDVAGLDVVELGCGTAYFSAQL